MNKPKIVIMLNGGLVQEVLSDKEVEVLIIDEDIDQAEDKDLVKLTDSEGDVFKAYVREEEPAVIPFSEEYFKQYRKSREG